MTVKLPQRDPEGAYVRKAIAQRKAGVTSKCKCGETRAEALVTKSHPKVCHECERKREGKTIMDDHHVFGESNNPTTIPVPVNDHRAELNVAQYDWPKQTRENPDLSPLLAAAASLRGFIDTVLYLIKKGVLWIADMLEKLDVYLVKKFGTKWWIGTELEQFAPKH